VGWSVALDHEILSHLVDELVTLLLILCFCFFFVPDALAYLADRFLADLSSSHRGTQIAEGEKYALSNSTSSSTFLRSQRLWQ